MDNDFSFSSVHAVTSGFYFTDYVHKGPHFSKWDPSAEFDGTETE